MRAIVLLGPNLKSNGVRQLQVVAVELLLAIYKSTVCLLVQRSQLRDGRW